MSRGKYRLHEFQNGAVNAALGAIGGRKNELIVLPTGSGKSVTIAGLLERLRPASTRRVLIVSHVREIIDQDATAIARHLPRVSLGVACSGLGRMEFGRDVTVASVQSIYRRIRHKWDYDLCIVDEAHLIGREEETMYRRVFGLLRKAEVARRRPIPIIGFTATPYRLDTGYLHYGEGALFERVAFDIPATRLIERGVLAPLTTEPVHGINFSMLPRREKEYVVAAYTSDNSGAWLTETAECVRRLAVIAADRKRWIIFCCTVKHADAVAEMLAQMSLRAVAIHTKTKKRDRDDAVRDFRAGKIRALINVNVLTTGFDAPDVDCIVLLRPTLSTGLYVQMLGRGMRKANGKTDCLVLDFAGNIERHGPLSEIIPEVMRPLKNVDPVGIKRKCPACERKLSVLQRQCPKCGYLFAEIMPAPSISSVLVPMETGAGRRIPPSDHEYLSTEEVAGLVGTTPQYVKQMRCLGTGPKFYSAGRMTGVGWRQIVYRIEDVERWQSSLTVFPSHKEGHEGRIWRVRPKGEAEQAA